MLAVWRGMKSSKQLVLRLFSIVVLYMAGMFAYQIWYTRLPTEVDTDSRDQLAQVQLVNSWTFKHLRELQESRVKVPNTTEKVEVEDCNCGLERMPDMKSSLLYGRTKPKGYLTIGIPSIARPENKTYIKQTIDSLINNANSTERNMTTLVIFLGDLEVKKKEIVAEYVMKLYYKEIQSGFIQIIHAPRDWYPSLEKLKVTYNHEMKQIKWRTKQNFDFAYMMLYSRTVSEYYLQLEDDVTTVPGYFEKIVSYIRKQETPWTCLEFSELGFIAKLFHSADLEKLSKLLLLFYNEQPNDVTYLYFNELMTQFQRRIRQPTIFQHHGLFSTLAGKYQRLKDKSFNTGKIFHGDNPPARIYTSLTVHEKHRPRKAYDRSDDFFWAKSPKKGDTFTIVFKKKQSFKRILIDSGSMQHPADIIDYGILQASPSIREQRPDYIECEDYVTLGQFEDGRIDVQITEELVPFEIACLEIKLILQQSSWIVIREIAVFLQVPQNLDELWALSRKFDQGNSRHKTKEHGGDNPPASIYSTFTGYHHHTPEMAYNTTTGFFWVEQPKLGDTYTIALHKPKSLVKIIVETGNSEHPSDRIEDGIVFVSYNVTERRPEGNVCGFYLPVGNFTDGRAAITLDYKKYPGEIACVQIKLTSDQENWILIREIALFLRSFYF